MSAERAPWHKRPLILIVLACALSILTWAGFFVWQVADNYILMKSGLADTLASANRKKYEDVVQELFARAIVKADTVAALESGDSPALGNPDADLHIVEFADFECPHCSSAAKTVRNFMAKHSHDAYFVFRDYPVPESHPRSEVLAMAARCVYDQRDSERYWRFHDLVFQAMDAHSDEDLRRYAMHVGADMRLYDDCLARKNPLADIRLSRQDALAAGVTVTPTFFFNGVMVMGDLSPELFEYVADRARERGLPK